MMTKMLLYITVPVPVLFTTSLSILQSGSFYLCFMFHPVNQNFGHVNPSKPSKDKSSSSCYVMWVEFGEAHTDLAPFCRWPRSLVGSWYSHRPSVLCRRAGPDARGGPAPSLWWRCCNLSSRLGPLHQRCSERRRKDKVQCQYSRISSTNESHIFIWKIT